MLPRSRIETRGEPETVGVVGSGNVGGAVAGLAAGASSRSRAGVTSLDPRAPGGQYCGMAYDEELASRIRALVAGEAGLTEQKMFGGLAFLVNGNMSVAASGEGGILLRIDPGEGSDLVASSSAVPMVMRGRTMQGWLRVDAPDVRDDAELARWVEIGLAYARSLPVKR
jgi:hypothetical protein